MLLSPELKNLLYEHYIAKEPKKLIPGIDYLPATGKCIAFEELLALVESSLDLWLTHGPYCEQFEKSLSTLLNQPYALFVNSGSSANLLALTTLTSPLLKDRRIRPGDEVITLAASFPTTVAPIVQNRAIPVFIDIELPTYQLNPTQLEKALSSRTKAIMVAHNLGNPFNLSLVKKFCEQHHLWLIEDCCDALGAKWQDRPVGSFGDLSTLSFYPAHQITTGEGGALLTSTAELKKIAQSFRDWGRDCWCHPGQDNCCGKRFQWDYPHLPKGYDHKYIYSHFGYNLKATDMQAAIGEAQLKKLPHFLKQRDQNFKKLYQLLTPFEDLLILPQNYPEAISSWFGFPLLLKDPYQHLRTLMVSFLEKNKIGTRPLFAGNLIRQPLWSDQVTYPYTIKENLVVTDKIMKGCFWVGIHPQLETQHMEYIVQIVEDFIHNSKLSIRKSSSV